MRVVCLIYCFVGWCKYNEIDDGKGYAPSNDSVLQCLSLSIMHRIRI